MPDFQTRTPGPISVTLELGTGDVRIAASDRTGTVVEVRPSNEADESDGKAAKQVRVDYAGGMLRVTGPKPGAFDFSRKTRSVDVSIELPSDSQVSLDTLVGDVRCAGRLGECRLKTSAGSFWLEQTGPLRLNTGHGHVHNLLENATRPEEAHETVEVRGHTSYGDIAIRRSRLASGTGEEGQP